MSVLGIAEQLSLMNGRFARGLIREVFSIIAFIGAWNNFLWPFLAVTKEQAMNVTVGITQVTDAFGVFIGGGPGVAPTRLDLPPDPAAPDGDDGAGTILPMSLAGAFVDGTGPRIVTLLDIARWGAYSIAADPARGAVLGAGQRVRYYKNHEEDFWYRSLSINPQQPSIREAADAARTRL